MKKCSSDKIRRAEDFRCVNKTQKLRKKSLKKTTPKSPQPKAEELVPPPLQKEIQKNLHFLDNLIKLGEGKKVSYDGFLVSEIITVYFHEKYKQHCPIYPIKTYSMFKSEEFKKLYENQNVYNEAEFKEYVMKTLKYTYIDWNKDKFLKNLKLCLETGEQLIMVPLRIPRHLNMLIIKVPTREIIRFEPHGMKYQEEAEDHKINTFLKNLIQDINEYLKLTDTRKFTYIDPSKLCPKYNTNPHYTGFQYRESKNRKLAKGEGGGFCQLWSWFFAECVIQNPEMDVREVYKEAFHALMHNEENFATIIRGYFFSINDELKKMKMSFTINKKKYKEIKTEDYDILLNYLSKSRIHLLKKERKPFTGGFKKHTFILPKANPQASPVHF